MTIPNEHKTFIVVDPSQDQPLALNRALQVHKCAIEAGGRLDATFHIFIGVDSDNTDTSADNPAVHRDQEWFNESILQPLNEAGVKFHVQLCWSNDWYGSIIKESKRVAPEWIVLPLISRPRESGRLFNEAIWRLLRTADCPVLITRPDTSEERRTVLAAVNFQSHKPEYQRLNDLIIDRGQWAETFYSADMHVVNAYSDSLNYPDRAQLVNATGVDSANIHVKMGAPDEVIAEVSREISADLVVLGIQKRAFRWRGNTAEKIITKVSCDILIIN